MTFACETLTTWNDFTELLKKLSSISDKWVYKGLGQDYNLATTLDRAGEYFDIDGSDIPGIEEQMIRNFRRRIQEEKNEELYNDRLYCMSLMQHHGSPTRLLDFTWSPYIGAFFAIDDSTNPPYEPKYMPVLWCINIDWIEKTIKTLVNTKVLGERWCDKHRNDKTFISMYMSKKPKKFVYLENPLRLNTRLVIQQGIFLVPGDVTCSYENNLKSHAGWNKKRNVLKIFLNFTKHERKIALHELHRMNINQASLFPGLDGYARSMKQLIPIFERMSRNKAGKGGAYKTKTKNCI